MARWKANVRLFALIGLFFAIDYGSVAGELRGEMCSARLFSQCIRCIVLFAVRTEILRGQGRPPEL